MKKVMNYIARHQLQGLVSNVKVKEFMTTPVVTLSGTCTISEAKEIMRKKRISGVPIVDDEEKLVGIISIEDIIISLQNSTMEDPINKHMTRNVISVKEDDYVSSLIDLFSVHTYHRLPVVNHDKEVLGVITKGDLGIGLSHHLLHSIEAIYHHNQRRKALLALDVKEKDINFCMEDKYFFYHIKSPDMDQAGKGSLFFKNFITRHSIPDDIIKRASISLYEAEVNVVIHACGKGNIRAYVTDDTLFIFVGDEGPGIADVDQAMQEGFSTASDEVREYGFGAGMGLSNMSQFSDKLIIISDSNGTKVEMMFYFKKEDDEDMAADFHHGRYVAYAEDAEAKCEKGSQEDE